MGLYKSIIAYDGTDFAGYQRQADDQRTVQGTIEHALRKLGWSGKSITVAGRTDAGVHARGQVVAFELAWAQGSDVLTRALNANLPRDVAVWNTQLAPADFHPRFSARYRRYRYSLLISSLRDPLQERYAWRVFPAVDLEAMRTTSSFLVGRHDFAAFGRPPKPEGSTVRNVYRVHWDQTGEMISFAIEADAFLYHMVRRLVAALVAVGTGRAKPDAVASLLDNPTANWQGAIAPACGLCLEAVIYD
ncbi:MAG: tRNA pseudouridine(38-40) synthase TruA [Anaerolineales bacterium]|jgi:tRNA pseudouridine38-40 synthase